MKTCFIIGGGEFDGFFDPIKKDDLVIAADKGYTLIDKENIKADIIIGDFDSSNKPKDRNIIALNPIKDFTDTKAAVEEGIKRGYRNFIIYGSLGGRESHTFANIRDAYFYKKKNINISLKTKNKKIFIVDDKYSHSYDGHDFYTSIFSLNDDTIITLKGLFYELEKYNLKIDNSLAVSNETDKKDFEIIVENGAVVVIFEDKNC